MTNEEIKQGLKEGNVLRFNLGEIKQCNHVFERKGDRVECKCGVGFYDPRHEFPLKEANEYFARQSNT